MLGYRKRNRDNVERIWKIGKARGLGDELEVNDWFGRDLSKGVYGVYNHAYSDLNLC